MTHDKAGLQKELCVLSCHKKVLNYTYIFYIERAKTNVETRWPIKMGTLFFGRTIVHYSDTAHNIPCEEVRLFWRVLAEQLAGPNQTR